MPTVSTRLYYSAPLTPDGPDDGWVIDALSNAPEIVRTFREEAIEVTITDLRDADLRPTLDDMGFERVVSPTLVDPRAIVEQSAPALDRYRQETTGLLTALAGADEVVFFDVTLRGEEFAARLRGPNQLPHLRVHVDQSPRSALAVPNATGRRDVDSGGSRSSTSGGRCSGRYSTSRSRCATTGRWIPRPTWWRPVCAFRPG